MTKPPSLHRCVQGSSGPSKSKTSTPATAAVSRRATSHSSLRPVPNSGATNARWSSLGLAVASQAGKTLFLQQETQDVLALLRALTDSRDRLAFGAFMRGPMVGLTDEELLDIAEDVHLAGPDASPTGLFDITTPPALVSHRVARSVLEILQKLRARVNVTTPRVLLAESIEQLQLRVALSARGGNNRAARSLANLDRIVELARPFDVRGLRAFVRHLQLDWDRRASRQEGRIDASRDAVEIVTIHSAKGPRMARGDPN